MLMVTNI